MGTARLNLDDWKQKINPSITLVAANGRYVSQTSLCHTDLYSQIMRLSLMKLVQLKADLGAIPEWPIPKIQGLDARFITNLVSRSR